MEYRRLKRIIGCRLDVEADAVQILSFGLRGLGGCGVGSPTVSGALPQKSLSCRRACGSDVFAAGEDSIFNLPLITLYILGRGYN